MNRITEITRRDILDLFRNGLVIDEFFETKTIIYYYWGRLRFLYKGIIINHNKNRASLH